MNTNKEQYTAPCMEVIELETEANIMLNASDVEHVGIGGSDVPSDSKDFWGE